jgi:hypothetical protein
MQLTPLPTYQSVPPVDAQAGGCGGMSMWGRFNESRRSWCKSTFLVGNPVGAFLLLWAIPLGHSLSCEFEFDNRTSSGGESSLFCGVMACQTATISCRSELQRCKRIFEGFHSKALSAPVLVVCRRNAASRRSATMKQPHWGIPEIRSIGSL